MDEIASLLTAYGICFGLSNDKVPLIPRVRKIPFFNRMLDCTYCTGFHAGWMTWILRGSMMGWGEPSVLGMAAEAVSWAFAGSAFCYSVDAAVQWFEKNSGGE